MASGSAQAPRVPVAAPRSAETQPPVLSPLAAQLVRPADFAGRFSRQRRGMGLRRRRARLRKRLAACAVSALALPAFVAPGGWASIAQPFDGGAFEIGNAQVQALVVEPMPFEQPGTSFPGSAFYYLEMKETTARDGGSVLDAAGAQVGPAARSFSYYDAGGRHAPSALDRSRALQCMTAAIYYEAASEPEAGQRAVAQVVLNRLAHPAYPSNVCGVVYEGSERATGCQFSFTCDGAMARRPAPYFWARAEKVAREALAGKVYAPVGLATHYHTLQVSPYWAPSLHYLTTIGAHRFYSFAGRAGELSSFRYVYGGGEPVAAPHARLAGSAMGTDTLDPVALQNAFAAPSSSAPAAPAQTAASALPRTDNLPESRWRADATSPAPLASEPAPASDAPALPGSTGVRPEYRNSGRWIARPGS
ncbi:cell wall hydrolase [Novosphingobium sp. YJ-S2-02]|uniref:Cell wall hydrolase n=2 Tax=Novosphingobium aureum TaxID=2792964 RepID=A0A931HAG3_9SPHN|nr:cell wall hydrolase [Novosphingobium aureum]